MYNPVSTYRLQFNKEFTLTRLKHIIPYLSALGIKTVYASPLFASVPGSTHGYDGTNPETIDPEIGSEEELLEVHTLLKTYGIGWLQDIVPNHQAFDLLNPWLADVLEKGNQSAYANFFDIDWHHPIIRGKLMVPFLGEPMDKLSEKGLVKMAVRDERYYLQVDSQVYPLNSETQERILSQSAENDAITEINDDEEALKQIVKAQHYSLCYWEEADSVINYRRFFIVNGLISLNMQDEKVFEKFHHKLLKYVKEGIFDGLRIDHIDGLYHPEKYLKNLRAQVGDEIYLVVEKILQQQEKLPHWPVQGNTGYDFLAMLNNLQTCKENKSVFKKKYARFTGEYEHPAKLKADKKREILHKHMAGDLDNLFRLFCDLDPGYASTLTLQEKLQFEAAIGELLIGCPVYRYYPSGVSDKGIHAAIRSILSEMEANFPALQKVISQLSEMLLIRTLGLDDAYNERALHFLRRCMQFTGPLMAKGVEDTLMYTYNSFIAHSEVGDDVQSFGLEAEDFHELMLQRAVDSPLTMNATSTHDTKRGEDTRARLNLLSEIPDEWFSAVKKWRNINKDIILETNIHPNDEYFIYQTIVGVYPFPGEDEGGVVKRLQEYLVKSLREGKLRSSWNAPDKEYESAVAKFISCILEKNNPFFVAFKNFLERNVDFGILNSLGQLTLKLTCPGVPDIYQGTELWDLSLVDPDNRRVVDFAKRQKMLDKILHAGSSNSLDSLWEERYTGIIKLFLTQHLLKERGKNPDLFAKGRYLPLKTKGKYSQSLFAFARIYKGSWCVVAIPIHSASLMKGEASSIGSFDWKNTRIILPPEAPGSMNLFWSEKNEVHNGSLYAKDLFRNFPVNLTRLVPTQSNRSAGILLSITSLPSSYGTGDLGPASYDFVETLYRARQKFWQILPLNPVSHANEYAPYSSYSSMAGNTLLISPELLQKEGLLDEKDLEGKDFESSDRADFRAAELVRNELFEKAFVRFTAGDFLSLKTAYAQFCEKAQYWLTDHSLYLVLKGFQENKAWTDWEERYKERDKKALEEFTFEHKREIEKEQWLQFIFDRQFTALKNHCAEHQVKLIGDLPFYIGYDSADVWANREIFDLDENGEMIGVSGVPPDYFNEEGQLWGMPVFRWDKLKENGYQWWLNRIARNLEFVDLLRLDHFRAFAGFWKVGSEEKTAVKGSWEPGPGVDFFNALKNKFPGMPFVAEDLGEITPDVYQLRDEFNLPGMRVLQFAFGDDVATSLHSPHNYEKHSFVFTGTHDNNTSLGWFRRDADKTNKKNLSNYVGTPVTEKNIHLVMMRSAYSSVSETVIIPMQDVLGLNESARMNTPAVAGDQWTWRMKPGEFNAEHMELLSDWTKLYNRH